MWPDSLFEESKIFSSDSPFRCLPAQVDQGDARDKTRLRAGFERVLRSEEARRGRNVVCIWALAERYRHSDGKRECSRIVYVEKTTGSIFGRWSPSKIDLLVKGTDANELPYLPDLRKLANRDTLLFYRTIIANYGPLRVWWAEVARLDEVSNCKLAGSRAWERHILKSYCNCYRCLPLKNRRC